MIGMRLLLLGAVPAAMIAAPALAQQATAPAPATTAAAPANPPATVVTQEGRLEKTDNGWRASQLVGATVYNDHGDSVGTIDDLIVGQDGKIAQAILSVGGFLGIGAKLVAIPYDQLKFQERTDTNGTITTGNAAAPNTPATTSSLAPTATNPGTTAATPATAPAAGNGAAPAPANAPANAPAIATAPAAGTATRVVRKTTRLVLPGATQDSVKAMPDFKYQPQP